MKLDSGDHSAKMKFSLSYENNLPFERAGNKTNFNQNEKFQTMAIYGSMEGRELKLKLIFVRMFSLWPGL